MPNFYVNADFVFDARTFAQSFGEKLEDRFGEHIEVSLHGSVLTVTFDPAWGNSVDTSELLSIAAAAGAVGPVRQPESMQPLYEIDYFSGPRNRKHTMPKPISKLPHSEVTPEPALEKRTRRRFSADYKPRIVNEADRYQRGEVSALLRREQLYSSQLQQWRQELAENGAAGLSKSSPGPTPSMPPEQRRIAALEKEKLRLKLTLEIAQDRLDLQKAVLADWRFAGSLQMCKRIPSCFGPIF